VIYLVYVNETLFFGPEYSIEEVISNLRQQDLELEVEDILT